MKRILVLGASGMLGHAVLRLFAQSDGYEAFGSVRSNGASARLPQHISKNLLTGVDVNNSDDVIRLFGHVKPHVVINCAGIVKQLEAADDPLAVIPINALLPHRLVRFCDISGARLVHISTDCVFSGKRGNYQERDPADADDLYGRSKYLGEVDYPNAVTLRTSIIGHELSTAHGLVGWFLSQTAAIRGYRRAIFSGLPTVELARVIRDYVLPHAELRGVYHVAATPISKYDLLTLVGKTYGRATHIVPDDTVAIDRSLDSHRFRQATGYEAPAWPDLVRRMHEFQ
jgi:dTDP-4-dehydrorhamnose reductase